jgi:hypothetical protein
MLRSLPIPPRGVPLWVALLPLLLAACRAPAEPPSARERLAAAYGVADFGQLEALRYTFHLRDGERELARSWEWEPHTGLVVARDPADPLSEILFVRGPDGVQESAREIDGRFLDDRRWLLLPLLLSGEEQLRWESFGPKAAPLSGTEWEHVVATGTDVHELFLDEGSLLREWTFRPGGATEGARTVAFEEPVTAGPLRLSLAAAGPDPTAFRVWFTDVALRWQGADDWQPVP